MFHFRTTLVVLSLLVTFSGYLYAGSGKSEVTEKVSRLGEYTGYTSQEYKGYKSHSAYITMRDSIKLAVDVFLPKKLEKDKKVPTIMYLTRYVRSVRAKFPFNLLKDPVLTVVPEREVEFFTKYGYAVIIVDSRGSGASTGVRKMEFSPAEVKDGSEVVDWVISQPWSDGNIGVTGVSYVGTTAEMHLVNQHPAVKACIPRHNIFDLYNHVMFPGGVRQGPFIKVWGETTSYLDDNNFAPFGKQAKRLVWGISPVDGDKKKKIYKEALASHAENFDVYEGVQGIVYRDDSHPKLDYKSNAYSIHSNRNKIEASGTPIYRIGGWYDGALAKSVIEGYWNTDNTERIMIGPWDHGPHDNASPFAETPEVKFDIYHEMLRFFDFHLKGIENGINEEPEVHYFTVGEEHWKQSNTWPPAEQINIAYYFSGDKNLVHNIDRRTKGETTYNVDYEMATANTARWNSVTGLYRNGTTGYPDRREKADRLLWFETNPLYRAVEVTGSPIAELYLRSNGKDAQVFCYLEDVAPDGTVTLITEGMLRAMHRKEQNSGDYKNIGPYHTFNKADAKYLEPGTPFKLSFDLLPISYQLEKGHKLRVSIAGADTEHFDPISEQPETFTLIHNEQYPSRMVIPIIPVEAGLVQSE